MGTRLVEQILTALDAQAVVVPGTAAAVLPRLADSLRDLLRQRDQLAEQVEGMGIGGARWEQPDALNGVELHPTALNVAQWHPPRPAGSVGKFDRSGSAPGTPGDLPVTVVG